MKRLYLTKQRFRSRPGGRDARPSRFCLATLLTMLGLLLAPADSVAQQADFGDAPLPYPTILNNGGARHALNQNVFLGVFIDDDRDGQPSVNADGDDIEIDFPDDEDGVVFLTALIPGQVAQVRVRASIAGRLNAWVDWEADGAWNQVDTIFLNQPLNAGNNTLNFNVPSFAVIGDTYARFRFSLDGNIGPAGPAGDGEVEDYRVTVEGQEQLDFGDAPDTYRTVLSSDGARHRFNPNILMGLLLDTEPDGQPTSGAFGDDINPPGAGDDEDGVSIVGGILIANNTATVQVRSTSDAKLDAWVDWDQDGNFFSAGDQIFFSIDVVPGINTLNFNVPSVAQGGTVFSRWRLSTGGGLGPAGPADDGEVEDHTHTLVTDLDYGDAPDSYGTKLASDGARHVFVPGTDLFLGSTIDGEVDGQAGPNALLDDNTPSAGPDDEDGVIFSGAMVAGQSYNLTVISGADGTLNAWVDFNANGVFDIPGETIANNLPLFPGGNSVSFVVPSNAAVGATTFSRFRLSVQGGLGPRGLALEGEVEDYAVNIAGAFDFGDAPDPMFPTLLANNGARHAYNPDIFLGQIIDLEPDGQPNSSSLGDDWNGSASIPTTAAVPDDEDGVFFKPMNAGSVSTVDIIASSTGIVNGWIDFNGNGSWADQGEHILVDRPVTGGFNTLSFNVPANARRGVTYSRIRYNLQGGLSYDGPATEGEVEDNAVAIEDPQIPCEQSSKGTEFWLTFPGNLAPDPDNPLKLSLSIVGPRTTTGTVSIPGLMWSRNFTIGASMKVVIPLPPEADLGDANDMIQDNGILVTASDLVAVFGLSRVQFTTDGYLGLPSSALGRTYMIQNYGNVHTGVPSLNGTQFGLVACEDNTEVTIRPSVDVAGHPADTPYTITLNAGQTYQLRGTNDAPTDLTGTIIQADKRIATFGSHQCANIPDENTWFCDYIVEQLLPAKTAGQNFVAMGLATRSSDIYRVTATQDNTSVSFDGGPATLINRGESVDQATANGTHITSDRPVFVSQYSASADFDGQDISDPFQIVIPSTDMYLEQYMVCVPDSGYDDYYINLVVPVSSVGTIRTNGVVVNPALFSLIGGSGFAGAQVPAGPGVHNIDNLGAGASGQGLPFWVSVYGYSLYDSFGWPGGFYFPDRTPPNITCIVTNGFLVADQECIATLPDLTSLVLIDDNCSEDFSVTQMPRPQTTLPVGTHKVTMTATDVNGNSATCQIDITVVDISTPLISCPQDLVVPCNNGQPVPVTFSVQAFTEQCGAPLEVICEPPPGSLFPPGETTVTCRATNLAGEETVCQFKVIVQCLTIQFGDQPGTVQVNWPGGGTLQSAPAPTGPWTDLPAAREPHIIPAVNDEFFRVRYSP